MDLLKNESIIKDVIQVAQGEMALEEFLKQVKETWQTYELEMVNYQNKCRLIRGWDDLFNKVCTFKFLKLGLHFSEECAPCFHETFQFLYYVWASKPWTDFLP